MDRVLTEEIWREVKRRAQKATSRKAAVAYVTKDLIGLRTGDVLIADASTRANPNGARALRGKQTGNTEAIAKIKQKAVQRATSAVEKAGYTNLAEGARIEMWTNTSAPPASGLMKHSLSSG